MAVSAVLWSALVFAAPQAQPAAPPAPPPTALIVGRVVDGSSGRPVSAAIVSLVGGGTIAPGSTLPATLSGGPRAVTNASGQFVFRRLAKGNYTLQVARTGYVDGAYGRRSPGGSMATLQIEDGQRLSDVVILVWKYGVISGTIADEAGEPAIGMQVRAFQRRLVAGRRRLTATATATTDDRGVYRLASLPPGEYLVAFVWREASMPAVTADMLRSPNTSDPKQAEILRERLSLGTFFTQNSVAVGGLVRELPVAGIAPPPSVEGAPIFIYPTQFFPGVPSPARAAVVTLASGQERESVDFSLRPVRTASVSGTVIGAEGPLPNVALRLVPGGDDVPLELETSVSMTGPGGDFTLLGVPAGQYAIRVLRVPRASAPIQPPTMTQIQVGNSTIMSSVSGGAPASPPAITDDPTIFGEAIVSVADRDVTDVVITLQRGARVTGRFEFDGSIERPNGAAMTRIPVSLDRVDAALSLGTPLSTVPPGRADESGVFKTYGVPPGKYLVRIVTAPSGWTVKSIMSEGRDLSDTPIDLRTTDVANVVVTFTDRPTKLNGVVRGTDGNVDDNALVVVFPADSSGWSDYGVNPRRVRSARPLKNGSYSFTGLPPGDYYVAAIHEEDVAQWQDPKVLEDLSRGAMQIKLAEGDTRVQDVKSTKAGRR